MKIDAGSFFILVATLAAGGGAGYLASEKGLLPHLGPHGPPPPPPAPEPAAPIADAGVEAAPPPKEPAPECDDDAGAPGACPPGGFPTWEGGCGSFAKVRCGEFKQAMKPRVAQAAVECLAKLTPKERCDRDRVNLCGHLALMNACPEDESDAGTSAASICAAIAEACGPSPIAPSAAECSQVVGGMTDMGRERMVACMKKHCFDKGVLFCEAVVTQDAR